MGRRTPFLAHFLFLPRTAQPSSRRRQAGPLCQPRARTPRVEVVSLSRWPHWQTPP
jgi:hypothetical protein